MEGKYPRTFGKGKTEPFVWPLGQYRDVLRLAKRVADLTRPGSRRAMVKYRGRRTVPAKGGAALTRTCVPRGQGWLNPGRFRLEGVSNSGGPSLKAYRDVCF